MPLLSQGDLAPSSDYVPIVDPSEISAASQNKRILANSLVMGSQFTQAGSGAAARTVESKLRESVSVKDFGAVGDGVADDTAAIQAAIDAVSSGASIALPSGNYLVSGVLTYGSKFINWVCGNALINGTVPSLSLTGAVSYTTSKTTRIEQRSGSSSSDIALIYNYRNANYTGGTGGAGGQVNAGFRQDLDVASTASANEWGILSVLQNSSQLSEAVAIYGQGNKMSGGGLTWAGVMEARDNVTVNDPASGLVGIEVDIFANGTDANAQRVAVDVVVGKGDASGSACRAAYGIRVGPVNGNSANGGFETGLHIYGQTTRGIDVQGTVAVGIDLSSATVSSSAVRLAAGQKLSLDATDTHYVRLNTGVLQYYSSGNALLEVSDADSSMSISGPLKILGAQILTARRTGWSAITGTASRAWFATSTATTEQIAQTLKALIDDLGSRCVLVAKRGKLQV
jgi:hypothetical protein